MMWINDYDLDWRLQNLLEYFGSVIAVETTEYYIETIELEA